METENQGRKPLRRNIDKNPGSQGTRGGWGGARTRLEMQKQGDRQSPESSVTVSSPLLPALYPQPKQDAVSMTTWLARKGGQGTAEEIFHISRKTGGRDAEKEPARLGGWGTMQGPRTPNRLAHRPQNPPTARMQHPLTPTSGPPQGRGKVWERTEGQSPKISHCPNLVCGVRGAAGSGAQTQIPEFKGMALDRVPRKVGVVGYGRLGESLAVGASPQVPSWGLKSLCPPPTILSSLS